MTLASMTGFARVGGAVGAWSWAWEIKSVNSKGLDLRLRVPPGFDAVEIEARALITKRLARGAVQATLSATRESAQPVLRINEAALAMLADAAARAPRPAGVGPATLDGLLAVRGVVETVEPAEDEAAAQAARRAALAGLDRALDALVAMRAAEGRALAAVLSQRLDRIAALTAEADANPARKAEAVKARLEAQIAELIDKSRFDAARLHQEAILMATKADIREELDRLVAHVAATRELLAQGGAIGRRLDFLAQEFGREANTLCAKANHPTLTATGMELRAEIEQLREQAQNIE